MIIAIAGLGYVGAVTAACLAEAGHTVVGVDVSETKVAEVNSGVSPLSELGLQDLIAKHVDAGSLRATTDHDEAVRAAELVIVCVGTPSLASGDTNLEYVRGVVESLGSCMRHLEERKTVLITSTIPPGTLESVVRPALEAASGMRSREQFGLAVSPEFLREGSAIADFTRPEKVVLGTDDEHSRRLLHTVFDPFGAPIIDTQPGVAEMVKFSANAWHALKVAFSNEIGRFCASQDIDSHEVMRIFKLDTRLNISDAYLTPGFAFGGSCLPKDLRTLTYRATSSGVRLPVLASTNESNADHLQFAKQHVEQAGPGRILLLGLAFKAGTDDLRESPSVLLAEWLLGKGREVRLFDEQVQIHRLVGANRQFVATQLPHLAKILGEDVEDELSRADVVVLSQWNPRFAGLLEGLRDDQVVVDLVGVGRDAATKATYRGLTW